MASVPVEHPQRPLIEQYATVLSQNPSWPSHLRKHFVERLIYKLVTRPEKVVTPKQAKTKETPKPKQEPSTAATKGKRPTAQKR